MSSFIIWHISAQKASSVPINYCTRIKNKKPLGNDKKTEIKAIEL